MYILKRPTKNYYSFGFENDIIDIWRDAVPTYKHRVTVWCIRNIICIGVMSCYGIVSPYPLRLWLQNRLLNRFGFYPCLTNIRPRSGLGSHINICCCDYSTTRYSMYPSQPEYGVHDTWTFHRVNLQVNVSCFTALKMMLHAVVIACCLLASCSYITVCSSLIVIDLFLIFDDWFFFYYTLDLFYFYCWVVFCFCCCCNVVVL